MFYLYRVCFRVDQLKKIEKQTGVPAHYIALGGIGAVAFAIFFNFAADFITYARTVFENS